nr:Cro/Cl family transcriptional regulator [uncultured Undibacterium sp.]
MKSVKFLETLQSEKNLNDSEVAQLLKKSKSSISQYKSGARVMDEEMCLALAMELDIDPLKIIAAAGMDRAEKSGQKSLWEVFMTRTQTAKTAGVSALLCFVFVINFMTTQEAKAAPVLALNGNGANVDFILCQING